MFLDAVPSKIIPKIQPEAPAGGMGGNIPAKSAEGVGFKMTVVMAVKQVRRPCGQIPLAVAEKGKAGIGECDRASAVYVVRFPYPLTHARNIKAEHPAIFTHKARFWACGGHW